jgi:VanZ family protein
MLSIGDSALDQRLARAAVAVTHLLSAVEVIQIHLPGRVAEVTDSLFALILALTICLSDRLRPSAKVTIFRDGVGHSLLHLSQELESQNQNDPSR